MTAKTKIRELEDRVLVLETLAHKQVVGVLVERRKFTGGFGGLCRRARPITTSGGGAC